MLPGQKRDENELYALEQVCSLEANNIKEEQNNVWIMGKKDRKITITSLEVEVGVRPKNQYIR